MKIHLSITGPLKKPGGNEEMDINIEGQKDIKEILMEQGYKEEEIEFIMCFLNDKPVDMITKVKDGDKITLTILVGGG